MIINKTFIKRRYAESRIGSVVINPVLQASNFIMLVYLMISNAIPFWIFVPLFLVGITVLVTVTGYKFRNIQLATDEDIKYEKQTKLNNTLYQIMYALKHPDHIDSVEFNRTLNEIKAIADIK